MKRVNVILALVFVSLFGERLNGEDIEATDHL